ncbi:MAG: hypothetical protein JWQ96_996 [Segetibacter sp.]|nr:hypothetical protein [Segetibacter sp.]
MDPFETKIYIGISIAAFLYAVILIVFISTIVKHQRKLAIAYERQVMVEINTLETERKRMASDLHDDLGPFLSSMKLQLSLLNTNNREDLSIIKDLSSELNSIIQKVRETSNDLMPNILIRKGLLYALNEFADKVNRTGALQIITQLPKDNLPLGPEKEIHLFRIFHEAVNNTIKHANATFFNIEITVTATLVSIKMNDDGRGTEMDIMQQKIGGLGVKSILSRVDILKGELFIDTKTNHGFRYTIEIPST